VIKEAIEKIIKLGEPNYKDIDGVKFSDKELFEVKKKFKTPEVLCVSTLSGLVDYCKSDLDDSELCLIHISSPTHIDIYGDFHANEQKRRKYLSCVYDYFDFEFNSYFSQEEFITKLLTQFEISENLEKILSLSSSIVKERNESYSDDGISQKITVKAGVAKIKDVVIENPLVLKPKMTFQEIEQSDYLCYFRISSGGELRFSLFDAGRGMWHIDSVTKIKKHLEKELGEISNIIKTVILA
jgi:hypothetical protein